MIKHIAKESAFIVLGLALPALSTFISLAVLQRRGLLFPKTLQPLAAERTSRV
jgi:hypothetical protein